MKVLHLNAGAETGGGMVHILSLLNQLNKEEFILGVFEQGEMYGRAKDLGIKVELFNQSSRYDVSILKRIVTYINTNAIDIVHTHGPRANLYASILKPFTKCKWVTTIHSDPRDDFLGAGIKGTVFTKLHFFSLKKMDHFFAISKRFTQMLTNFGVSKEKITTIYNGIDFSEPKHDIIERTHLGLNEEDFVIIMVARLHPVKGHTIAFDALKSIETDFPSIKLLLIGDGPIENELKEKVRELNLTEKVFFMGHQENIHGYFLVSDAEILTSYSESFPLVILEAARAKVPVISTDVGGVKDLITDDSLGRVIPVEDVEALSKNIIDFVKLKEKGQLETLGENLYLKASKTYSLENFANSVYETYMEILS
ncbi:glycosyltransferase family 4 protein [Fredinandcohnia onubensis]|uniref:glycosyltransferase family 4 protein n=1 Tax=Fredinandcohnia onubensis TaxID=1571209 RepID=UPI000C0BF475|nr:glycosyltransferase family 4 protein [Fredinandcohnia onubensis]